MKVKYFLPGALVLLGLLLLVLWWKPAPVARSAEAPTTGPGIPASAGAVATASNTPKQSRSVVTDEVYAPEGLNKDQLYDWWEGMLRKDPDFEFDRPIRFYGKAIDQFNQPVTGAKVDFGWNGMRNSEKAQTVTDEQGMFKFEGERGKILEVEIWKEGYHSNRHTNHGVFEYADPFNSYYHRPDPDKPVIFHLRKEGAMEPMILHTIGKYLMTDGRPYYLNLETGKLSEQQPEKADLVIKATRVSHVANWKADFTGVVQVLGQGGFVEDTDYFMFTAPDSGYQPELRFISPAGDTKYKGLEARRVYIRTAAGTYAAAEIQMGPFNKPAPNAPGCDIQISYWYNPSGSRNLEYSGKQAFEQH